MRKAFKIIFTFEFFGDEIVYKTVRSAYDKTDLISYVYEWIKKFGTKYGNCICVEIHECGTKNYTPILIKMKGE